MGDKNNRVPSRQMEYMVKDPLLRVRLPRACTFPLQDPQLFPLRRGSL